MQVSRTSTRRWAGHWPGRPLPLPGARAAALLAGERSEKPPRAPRDGKGGAARFVDVGKIWYGAGGLYVLDHATGEPSPNGGYTPPALVRRVELDGTVRTMLGTRANPAPGRQDPPALTRVYGATVDAGGTLYLIDEQPAGIALVRITARGDVTTVARLAPGSPRGSLATLDGKTFYLGGFYQPFLRRWRPPDPPEILIGNPAPYPATP